MEVEEFDRYLKGSRSQGKIKILSEIRKLIAFL